MTPEQIVAALIVFNGHQIAPFVQPFPANFTLPMPRETPAFLRVCRYMGRYKELIDRPQAFRPFDLFQDASGPLGVAVSPWLRGGSNYLQSMLAPLDIPMVAAEAMPTRAWFTGTKDLRLALRARDYDAALTLLEDVRSLWDVEYTKDHDMLKRACASYYERVQATADALGFETAPHRLAEMRRKTNLFTWA